MEAPFSPPVLFYYETFTYGKNLFRGLSAERPANAGADETLDPATASVIEKTAESGCRLPSQ
jgi:hypothetical protein